MIGKDPDKEWEEFGRKDPYYGAMTCDKFRKNNLEDKHIDEFFQSGRDHVEYILDTIRTSIHPGFSPTTALDFGCGVGRVAIPLAGVCPDVVGVDVSSSMLEEARKNCIKQSVTNLEFHTSDDELSNVSGTFDLVHSTFTFQHIPRKRGKKIVKRLIELLSDDGVAVLDFLVHRDIATIAKTVGLLRKKVPLFNHMSQYSLREAIFRTLDGEECLRSQPDHKNAPRNRVRESAHTVLPERQPSGCHSCFSRRGAIEPFLMKYFSTKRTLDPGWTAP